MARFPDWYSRLDTILQTLAESPLETLGRREMQILFACSERDSLRLLNQFGAVKQKDALRIAPVRLRTQLEDLRDSPAFQRYRQRGGQVAAQMSAAQLAAQARFRRIAGSVKGVPRKLAELPEGITLEPGRLEVRFQLEEDLWHLLDQLADIAAQDEQAFRQRAEPAIPARRKHA
jgi:hypothetical protein